MIQFRIIDNRFTPLLSSDVINNEDNDNNNINNIINWHEMTVTALYMPYTRNPFVWQPLLNTRISPLLHVLHCSDWVNNETASITSVNSHLPVSLFFAVGELTMIEITSSKYAVTIFYAQGKKLYRWGVKHLQQKKPIFCKPWFKYIYSYWFT